MNISSILNDNNFNHSFITTSQKNSAHPQTLTIGHRLGKIIHNKVDQHSHDWESSVSVPSPFRTETPININRHPTQSRWPHPPTHSHIKFPTRDPHFIEFPFILYWVMWTPDNPLHPIRVISHLKTKLHSRQRAHISSIIFCCKFIKIFWLFCFFI